VTAQRSFERRLWNIVTEEWSMLKTRQSKAVWLVAAVALAAACSKGPAEAALKAADEAVASASRDGERFASQQLKALRDGASAAHQEFDRGDYAAAKTSAEHVVADAQDVIKAAAAKKDEATKAWSDLQARVPGMREAIRAKLDELAAMKRLPKGVTTAQLADAKSGLAAFDQDWTDATAAAQSGDLVAALEKGRAASARAQELRNALGLAAPAEAAPSPQPSAVK